MSYPIQEQLLKNNRPGAIITPQGLVIHDTDDPGATAQNLHDYWNSTPKAQASAHYAVDWGNIIRMIPENEKAWHAGATANKLYLSFEMCVPVSHDVNRFNAIWDRAVWLASDILKRYGWGIDKLYSHNDISSMYHETDHTDPIGYFKEYDKTWADFKNAVSAALKPAAPTKSGSIVLYGDEVDKRAAAYLSDFLECTLFDARTPYDYSKILNVYGVGGKPATNGKVGWTSYLTKEIAGIDRYDTCEKVLDFIKTLKK